MEGGGRVNKEGFMAEARLRGRREWCWRITEDAEGQGEEEREDEGVEINEANMIYGEKELDTGIEGSREWKKHLEDDLSYLSDIAEGDESDMAWGDHAEEKFNIERKC